MLCLPESISPYVRIVKIQRILERTGQWTVYDNVMTYMEEGEADFILEGKRYSMKKGDVIVMPPMTAHTIITLSTKPLMQYILHFDFFESGNSRKIQEYSVAPEDQPFVLEERERIFCGNIRIVSLSEEERAYFRKRFLRLYREFHGGQPYHEAISRQIASELLYLYFRAVGQKPLKHRQPEQPKSKSWAHIEAAVLYIGRHFADPATDNASVSRAVGISSNHLTSLFKKYLDLPLHEYLLNFRIEKAKQFLNAGNTVTEAAALTGFSSIHVFSKDFKRMTGLSPSAFVHDCVYKDPLEEKGKIKS